MSNTYSTGQTPTVGDIVKVSRDNTFSHYSSMRSAVNNGDKFVVTDVVQGLASTLIKVKPHSSVKRGYDTINAMKASSFVLEKSASISVANKNGRIVTHVIFPRESATVAALAFSDDEAMKKLEDLLLQNPGKEYNVYKYASTATTERPRVQLEDRLDR